MRTRSVHLAPGILAALLLTVAPGVALSQYTVRSPYLMDPTLAIGYVDSCATFWEKAYDSLNGGFFTNIGRSGNVKTPYDKYLLSQTRNAYGFVRAFMLTGQERYLTMARRALDFMYRHHWDTTRGGWITMVDRFGGQTSAGWQKTAFDQHYALLGPSAYVEATQDTLDWAWLNDGYESNETHLWDSGPTSEGYFDNASADWSVRTGKSFNATVDAVTTHLLTMYLMTQDALYATRLKQMADQMVQRFAGTMGQQRIGFVEMFSTDWSWSNTTANNNTRTIMGHVLKTAWCLGRIHQLFPDPLYVATAESLMNDVLAKGYDHHYGGPYKDYDRVTGEMFMYGQDTAKAWWQMEQAITAGLMLYEITKKESYLAAADATVDFFMRYFVDHVYGDVYSDRFRNGAAITAWGNDKGNAYKAGYHSIELGYYLYLYGNLFVRGLPVTLYYRFQALDEEREIRLNPLAYSSPKYRIQHVLADGTEYTEFDAANRTLHLPPGTGGLFAVRYEPVLTGTGSLADGAPQSIRLLQNFPNPFNPATTIRYALPEAAVVRLAVFNAVGQRVADLVDETQAAGYHEVRFDGSSLSSGVYFYRLQVRPLESAIGRDSRSEAGDFVQTKRLLLLK